MFNSFKGTESSDSPEDSSSFSLQVCHISPKTTEITWKINNALRLQKELITPEMVVLGDYSCCITVTVKKLINVSFGVLCQCCGNPNPQVECQLGLRTREATLYKIIICEDGYHVTETGTILFCSIPWDELVGKADSLLPGGVMTLVCRLSIGEGSSDEGASSAAVAVPTQAGGQSAILAAKGMSSNDRNPSDFYIKLSAKPGRALPQEFGEVQARVTSSSRVEATWTVPDFFNLPCDLTKGVVSRRFSVPGGMVFFCLHPYGTHDKQGFTRIAVSVICSEDEGIRSPGVDCEVSLRTPDGARYKSLPNINHTLHGGLGCVFFRYFRLAEIVDRNKSLLPEGIITACIEITKRAGAASAGEGGGISATSGLFQSESVRPKTRGEPNTPLESLEEIKTSGKLTTSVRSTSEVKVMWEVQNFFDLPCTLKKGVISSWFDIPGGKGFIALHPYGTEDKPDFAQFAVTCLCPEYEGIRNPEMGCELSLRASDGTAYGSLANLDHEVLGGGGCAFYRYLRSSELVDRKESLVPWGVLVAHIELRSREKVVAGAGETSVPPVSAAAESDASSDSESGREGGKGPGPVREAGAVRPKSQKGLAEGKGARSATASKDRDSAQEPGTSSESPEIYNNYGKVKQRMHSAPGVHRTITWEVPDFFDLPCTLKKGILSPKFDVPGGCSFIGLHPYGTEDKPELVQFAVAIVCRKNEGLRNPEVGCELALRADDGTPCRSVASADSDVVGEAGCAFYRYLRLSELVDRKESLVSGGVLTVRIDLKTAASGGRETCAPPVEAAVEPETSSESDASSESDSEPARETEADPETAPEADAEHRETHKGDVEEKAVACPQLPLRGEDVQLTMRVEGETFQIFMSILVGRSPAFASEIQQLVDRGQGIQDVLDVKDICTRATTLRMFLNYLHTGKVESHLPTDVAFELYVMADKYKMDDLKRQCSQQSKRKELKWELLFG